MKRDFDSGGRVLLYTPMPLEYDEWTPPLEVKPLGEANLCSSLTPDFKHKPVLDIDVPARLYPSSTEGHSHLYIDVEMTHEQYTKLIDVLAEVGILGKGIAKQLEVRGVTTARLPWVKKEDC